MASPIVGKVLSDQYRVDRYIASGGMASVFQVWDLKRNVPLAMKVLQTDLAEDPVIVKRFRREARAMQKLSTRILCLFTVFFKRKISTFCCNFLLMVLT